MVEDIRLVGETLLGFCSEFATLYTITPLLNAVLGIWLLELVYKIYKKIK